MQDLMEAEVQDILLNTFSKKPYMILKKEVVTVNRITLFDIISGDELKFQIDSPNQIIVSRDMQIIEPRLLFNRSTDISEFNKIEKDFAEKYLLNTNQYDRLLGLIQQLNALPSDTYTERKVPEKGTKTTTNSPGLIE